MQSNPVALNCVARRARLQVDLGAIKHNYKLAKANSTGELLAVVKANAYGHGLAAVVAALDFADGFAVSCIAEALALRQLAPSARIVVLQGFLDSAELQLVFTHNFECVIHQQWQLQILYNATLLLPPLQPINIWLKFDSGMHRLGLTQTALLAAAKALTMHAYIGSLGVMTHFACADNPAHAHNQAQLQQVHELNRALQAAGLHLPMSLANSAALALPEANCQVQRLGLALYGVVPFAAAAAAPKWYAQLCAAMSFKSVIIAINEFARGASIGYGASYTCSQAMRVAVVAAGYADGYPLAASTADKPCYVLVAGCRCALLGRVSMDMLCIDVSACAAAAIGSEVLLFGAELPVTELATSTANLSYQLLCAGAGKVALEYIDS